jgi:hypothetical protein
MGAGQSVSDQGKTPSKGLHILRVTPSSPASCTDLEPFFDFIVGYEDPSRQRRYTGIEAHDFERVVEEHEGRALVLVVWNNKARSLRRESIRIYHPKLRYQLSLQRCPHYSLSDMVSKYQLG